MTIVSNPRRLMPPVYFLGALVLMTVLHLVAPGRRLVGPPWEYLGVLGILIGLWLAVTGTRLFGRHGTPIRPFQTSTALVTEGPYRFTRNPMYLGMVLVLSGAATVLGTFTPWLVVPAFVLLIQRRFIRGEETLLEQTFGERYSSYRERVRRWF